MYAGKIYLSEVEGGLRLSLYVQPNAPKSAVVGEFNGALKIKIKALPIEGRANEEIVAFLSRHLGLSKSQIQILKGETSRHKAVLLIAKDLAALAQKL